MEIKNVWQAIEDEQGLFLSEARRILSEGFFWENTEGVSTALHAMNTPYFYNDLGRIKSTNVQFSTEPAILPNRLLAVLATVSRHCFYNVYFVSIRVFYLNSFRTVGHSVNNRLLVFA